jgi:hypothetical protein
LIDDLDALGADVADTEQKAACLEAAGTRVTWMAVTPAGAPDACVEGSPSHGFVVPWERCAEAIRARLAEARWHRVVLASATPGGGALARLLPHDAVWWPTGIAPPAGGASLTEVVRRLLRADPSLAPLGSPDPLDPPVPLAWSATEDRTGRRAGLPLWDGDLLLLPEGVDGPAALPILAAFARLAERWSGIDLVTWSHPTAEGDGHARAHGVDTRLHAVGPPRRSAEWAWWSQAAGAVLTGTSRCSGGLLLRALASGCPLLWVAPAGPAAELARWMSDRGVAQCVKSDASAIAAAITRTLERAPEIESAVRAGRALAARQDPTELTVRLGAGLGLEPRRRSAAA